MDKCPTCHRPLAREPLSKRQRDVLGFIVRYRAKHVMAPTLMEISAELRVRKWTAHYHVGELIRKGWLTKQRHTPRSLTAVVQ